MLPRDLYEIVHIIGLALVMTSLGGIAIHAAEGGPRKGPGARRGLLWAYGAGLFLILLGGFGMLARLGLAKGGMAEFPGWLWAKLAVWAILGAVMAIPYRAPKAAVPVLLAVPLLAGLATYFALYKPF